MSMSAAPPTPSQIVQWRQDTPGCSRRVHLNNAGASLMPISVLRAITSHLELEANIGGYESAESNMPAIEGAYEALANLLHTQPRNIAVVENATVGFFQALSAFDLQRGDVIVTTRNDFISHQLAYLNLAQRQGVIIRRAHDLPSGGVDPDSVRSLLREPHTRMLAVTWVPTNSGLVQPVEELGVIAEQAGVPYLVDACQALGQYPIDIGKLRCDFLSATARKFLRGPRGIGMLYVSDRALSRGWAPLYTDMRGADWVTPDTFEVVSDARRFENWEFPYALVLGLGEAARYAARVGVEVAGMRARQLAATLRSSLTEQLGLRILDRGSQLAAIVTVELPRIEPVDMVERLRECAVNTSATLRGWAVLDMDDKRVASALRISPHYFNTEEELAAFLQALSSSMIHA
jgi:selenocysteine lyase/cysteine desulfurase